jgi:D-glycero-alpha-D-manno-heptose 1-phosphate guanylyltransferase
MTTIPDVIILSGGFGTRLKGVIGDVPKPMAQIAGRPFLELLLRQVKRQGFSRVILSVGYKQEVIREHFGNQALGLRVFYSIEDSPLGTGGALKEAGRCLETEAALVMNGDSYTDADLARLVREHAVNDADVTVVVIPETRSDAGSVVLGEDGQVRAFAEKRAIPGSRYLSAGIYMLNRDLLAGLPVGVKLSLEEQLFPQWLAASKKIMGFVYNGPCIDIGTPERFQIAQNALEKMELGTVLESEGRS